MKKTSNTNDKLIKTWLKLEQVLNTSNLQTAEENVDQFDLKNLLINQKKREVQSPQAQYSVIGQAFSKNPYTNSNPNFMQRPKTPILSTISSIKNLLSAKAHSRPYSRPGTANPRVTLSDPMELISNISRADFDRLRKETEKIHSLKVDDILDIYTSKCKDNKVEYMPSQALKFIEKFRLKSKNRKFYLKEMMLGIDSAKVLYKILQKNEHFNSLEFEKNLFSNVGTIILADAIRSNNNIIHINLSSNDIGPEGAQALFASLLENNSVISIDISSKEGLNRNRLGVRGVEPLEWILKKNKLLQFLNLASTSFGLTGLECILAGLENNNTLVDLNISGNELGPQCAPLITNVLYTTQLLEMNLSNNRLTDDGIEKLAVMFRLSTKNTILEKIDLSNNEITSLGIAKLFDVLQKNIFLKKLILSNNRFSGRGFNAITYLLWENSTLMYLDFKNCDVESEGGEAIANGLAKNDILQYLILRNNNIKSEGCKFIATALQENKRLKWLDLSKCRISDEGGLPLAQLAKSHPTLHYIFLRENNLHDETGLNLAEAVRNNKNIKILTCERNPISYKYTLEIRKFLQNNLINYKTKRVPTYYKKVIDLKSLEAQKENIIEETIELDMAEKKNREELENQRNIYQKQKEEERKKNEIIENNLQDTIDELRKTDNNKEIYEKNIKNSILELERNINHTEIDIGKEHQEIGKMENDLRLIKEKQQIRKSQLENKVQDLKKELADIYKRSALVEASFKSFDVQVQSLKNRINNQVGFMEEEKENDVNKDNKKLNRKMSTKNNVNNPVVETKKKGRLGKKGKKKIIEKSKKN